MPTHSADPTLRKPREGPRICCCAAPAMGACAAFCKESRMKFVDHTKPYRKSRGMGLPGLFAAKNGPVYIAVSSQLVRT
jgi:hypothetical protein